LLFERQDLRISPPATSLDPGLRRCGQQGRVPTRPYYQVVSGEQDPMRIHFGLLGLIKLLAAILLLIMVTEWK
jgi:hypothetical protein